MKAMLVNDAQKLVLSEVAKPVAGENEVLIRVRAIGLNRADLLQRKGTYPSPKGWPQWPGLEVAGEVEALGEQAALSGKFQIGDKVCALLGGGGYAEYVCAPAGLVMPMPKNLSYEEASTLPEAYATSYLNLFWEGHVKEGQTAFIPAGASGLASVAIPMAKAFGVRVITSVLSDEIAEKIKPLRADIVINSTKEDVAEILKAEEAAGRPINMSMDCLCGETLGKSLPYMAEGGYWVVISTLAGTETNILLRPLLTKGLHLVGSMLRKRSNEEKEALLNELVEKVWPKIEAGVMQPSIYKVLLFEEANAAQDILERGENIGKVVLRVE